MVKLKKDSTVDKLCQEVSNEHGKRFFRNAKLKPDEVYDIVASQFSNLAEIFLNQDSVKIDYIGKFLIKQGRKDFLIEERGIIPKQVPELEKVKVVFKIKPKVI